MNAPDIIVSLFTGAMAARVATKLGASALTAAGAATTAATVPGVVQSTGDLANAIHEDVMQSSDEELQKENEAYRGFRNMGLSEEDARGKLISYQQGYLPAIAGALSAFTGRFGAEGIFKRQLTQNLTRGAIGRTASGTLREAGTEGLEEGAVDLLTQYGVSRGRDADLDIDWYQTLQAATKGAAAGGPMGGAVELVGGKRDARSDLGQDINEALAPKKPVTTQDIEEGLHRLTLK
jgi:hypothetical protein